VNFFTLRSSFVISLFLLIILFAPRPISAAQIRLAWDPNTEQDLAGYKLYYGTASGSYGSPINVGNVTTYTLTGLIAGKRYFIAVTAYDNAKPPNESGYSNEVSGLATDSLPPPSEVRGDFDGDGKPDLVWRNQNSGENLIWLMDGTTYGGYTWLPTVTDTDWEIVGTGDFDGDGKPDLVWRHRTAGWNVVWLMDGTIPSSAVGFAEVTDTDWEIVGTGDFDGDGKPDLVWRHRTAGWNVVWLMDGTVPRSTVGFAEVTDTDWEIVGMGDFNGDGKPDLVWRHRTAGWNVVWLMDGTVPISAVGLPQVSYSSWEIVGPK
jgi:hypothetical protein